MCDLFKFNSPIYLYVIAANAVFPGLIAGGTLAPHAFRAITVDISMGTQAIHYRHRATFSGDGNTATFHCLNEHLLLITAAPESIQIHVHKFIRAQNGFHHLFDIFHNQMGAI